MKNLVIGLLTMFAVAACAVDQPTATDNDEQGSEIQSRPSSAHADESCPMAHINQLTIEQKAAASMLEDLSPGASTDVTCSTELCCHNDGECLCCCSVVRGCVCSCY
jgi:hypothetical protein